MAAAKRTGKKLAIGYQSRYRPDSEYLKQACERGDLGRFTCQAGAAAQSSTTWGVFLDAEKQGGGPSLISALTPLIQHCG